MKKEYTTPYIDVIMISFEDTMKIIDISTPEDTHLEGGDVDF